MKQQKLEQKVRELFERQGFDIEKHSNIFQAEKDGEKLILTAFSSEEYSLEDLEQAVSDGKKVFVDEELEEVQVMVENQVSVLREKDDEEYDLPSYELIGEIAVINELTVEEDEAVKGILENHPSVKTILLKEEPLQGEFRVGEYSKLYGEETETVHKEFGCRFKVDPTKVYYSERFSTERKRVVEQIEDGEKVLVMFAGVGPFAIMAAILANPEKVVAVEKNPDAASYLRENIELNDIGDVVGGYEGDVRDIVPELEGDFDRVIMPLPESAFDFMDLASTKVCSGSFMHIYTFMGQENLEASVSAFDIPDETKDANFEVVGNSVCGDRSPFESRCCLDVRWN